MKTLLIFDSNDQDSQGARDEIKKVLGEGLTEIDAGKEPLGECIGCFGCWIKTPGKCLLPGSDGFLKSLLSADRLILLTRIVFGGYSPAIKTYMDRCLPILHPYFVKYNGEMHHRLRYRHYPALITIGYGAGSMEEEEIFKEYTRSHRDNLHDKNERLTLIYRDSPVEIESWLKGNLQCV